MSLPTTASPKDMDDPKPSRYVVARSLPTLSMRTVEKLWNFEYVDMEEFIPSPHSLCLAEQGKPTLPLRQPSWSLQPVSGYPAAEGTVSRAGHDDVDKMFLPLHGSDGKEAGRDDPVHGGTSSLSLATPPEGDIQIGMAGVRYPVSHGDGSLR